MELIKKIKEAETQAQQIIAEAKAHASGQAENSQHNRRQTLAEAEQKRKKTIEAAVAAAQSQAIAEVENLKSQAEKQQQHLRKSTNGKMEGAIAKVMDYLRG